MCSEGYYTWSLCVFGCLAHIFTDVVGLHVERMALAQHGADKGFLYRHLILMVSFAFLQKTLGLLQRSRGRPLTLQVYIVVQKPN